MGYSEVTELTDTALSRAVASRSFFAEHLQAIRRYDDAIAEYIDREQDECLTDRERGLVLRCSEEVDGAGTATDWAARGDGDRVAGSDGAHRGSFPDR